jgi:pimeloyl-ACP methyl ester carboxylesterase
MKRLMTRASLCAALPLVLLAQGTTGQTSLKTVRVNGAELHYVDQGSGVPVVFVHGGLEDYREWHEQVEAFSKRYRAIAYSRRYNYPNLRVVPESRYSPIVDADDLAALIKKLGLAPAHIVGHSYGAYVALFLAASYPCQRHARDVERVPRGMSKCRHRVLRQTLTVRSGARIAWQRRQGAPWHS